MADKIRLVQGDTKPAIIISLTDEETGAPVAVSGATVKLYLRAVGEDTILLTKTAFLLPGVVTASGSIDATAPYDTLGAGGRLQFVWSAGDLDIEEGAYEGEIEITFSDGSIQTVYDTLKFSLREDF